jgi:nucleoside transporter
MSSFLKTRLCVMMFLQYVIWGSWYVTMTTYLTQTLNFTGLQAGAVFGTTAIASLVSPFFVGLIADRFFSTERVMAALYALGAIFMLIAANTTSFSGVYGAMLAFCLCYFPTIALTNSLTMQQVADVGRDFPPIRALGAIGWIVINNVVGAMGVEATATPFLIGAGFSAIMCVYSLVALPHTPPKARGQKVSAREILGLDFVGVMLKDRAYLVFAIASFLACIPLTFYYSFTNPYLNEMKVVNAAGKMTLGQISETALLFAMPFVLRYINVRQVLLIGLFAWAFRYTMLALGNADAGMWMFYLAIIVHGVCYDFFFVAGYMYTDQVAPPHLRSAAQGFITFVTYGVGMLLGSYLSGYALDYFTVTSPAGELVRDWRSFWFTSASISFAILLLVFFFFRTRVKIQAKDREGAAVATAEAV